MAADTAATASATSSSVAHGLYAPALHIASPSAHGYGGGGGLSPSTEYPSSGLSMPPIPAMPVPGVGGGSGGGSSGGNHIHVILPGERDAQKRKSRATKNAYHEKGAL